MSLPRHRWHNVPGERVSSIRVPYPCRITTSGVRVSGDFQGIHKNGTFPGSERASVPVRLADGDTIRVGSVLMTFHVRAFLTSEETQLL